MTVFEASRCKDLEYLLDYRCGALAERMTAVEGRLEAMGDIAMLRYVVDGLMRGLEHRLALVKGEDTPPLTVAEVAPGRSNICPRAFTGRSQRLITLPFRAILICGELWEDTQRKNATRDGVALPQSISAAHATDTLLNQVDSIACARAPATPHQTRGVPDDDRPRLGPTGPAAAVAA